MKQYFLFATLSLHLLGAAAVHAQPCDILAPVCKAGIPVAVHTVDADGDGIMDSGGFTITAQELLQSPPTDCPGPWPNGRCITTGYLVPVCLAQGLVSSGPAP